MQVQARIDAPGKFTAAVFAGGQSTRMGRDKAFLNIGGDVLLARQLRCVQDAGADELFISGRTGTDYSRFETRVVYDTEADAGPLAGLAAVLQGSRYGLILVLAVDMPAMTAAMLRKIIANTTAKAGCIPVGDDGFEPLAAAYPKAALELAQRQLKQRRLSMQSFARQAIDVGFLQPMQLSVSDQQYFLNWNEPSDCRDFDGA